VTTIRVGTGAGHNAASANYANLLGYQSGQNATNANYANFLGIYSGQYATSASSANFLGIDSGRYATSANGANFLGAYSGQNATSANYANFLGYQSGQYAASASHGNYLGFQSGRNATNAARSIFIGPYSGTNRADTIWLDTKSTASDGSYMPLILGYCDTRSLIVNGTLLVTNTATFPGSLYVNNLYYTNLTDYSDAPDSLSDAVEIVMSHEVKAGKVDHSKLSPLAWGSRTFQRATGTFRTNTIAAVWSEEKRDLDGTVTEQARELEPERKVVTPIMESVTEPDPASRNVSKTISAQAMVIKDLLTRLEALEKRVEKLEGQ